MITIPVRIEGISIHNQLGVERATLRIVTKPDAGEVPRLDFHTTVDLEEGKKYRVGDELRIEIKNPEE